MRLRPLSDQILVRPLDPERVSRGGIHIPDVARSNQKEREKSLEGVALAVGPGARIEGPDDMQEDQRAAFFTDGAWRRRMEVKPGDRIVFRNLAYSRVRIQGEELLVMNEGDVLARYEG